MAAKKKKRSEDELQDLIDLEQLPDLVDEEVTVGIDGVLDELTADSNEVSTGEDVDPHIVPDTNLPPEDYADDPWSEGRSAVVGKRICRGVLGMLLYIIKHLSLS